MAERLHADFPAIQGKTLVLVYPSGGILPIRAWPLGHYRRLCAALLADGYAVGIVGLQSDKPIARVLLDHCKSPQCVDLTGYTTSVRELLALFYRASLLITNDGGPVHFAALTPIPTIVFFGPRLRCSTGLYRRTPTVSIRRFPALLASPRTTTGPRRCDGDNQCLERIPRGTGAGQGGRMLESARGARYGCWRHSMNFIETLRSSRLVGWVFRHRFVKFGTVGGSGVLINLGVLYLGRSTVQPRSNRPSMRLKRFPLSCHPLRHGKQFHLEPFVDWRTASTRTTNRCCSSSGNTRWPALLGILLQMAFTQNARRSCPLLCWRTSSRSLQPASSITWSTTLGRSA